MKKLLLILFVIVSCTSFGQTGPHWIQVKGEGVFYKLLPNDSLSAKASSVDAGTTIIIWQNHTMTADADIPENVTLQFTSSGRLSGPHTLTINGALIAPPVQIFGSDLTVCGGPKVPEVYAEWFGAAGDGVTDDRVAIQKAIDFCFESVTTPPDRTGRTPSVLRLLPAVYRVSGSLTFRSALSISGAGGQRSPTVGDSPWGGTAIVLDKDVDEPVFISRIFNHHTLFENLRIEQEPGSTSSVTNAHGIYIASSATSISGFGECSTIRSVAINNMGGDGVHFGPQTESTPLYIDGISTHHNGGFGLNIEGENFGFCHVQRLKGDGNNDGLLRISGVSSQSDFYFDSIGAESGPVGTSGHLDQVILIEDCIGINLWINQLDIRQQAPMNPDASIIRVKSTPSPLAGVNLNVNQLVHYAPAAVASPSYKYIFYDEGISTVNADAGAISAPSTEYYSRSIRSGMTDVRTNPWVNSKSGFLFHSIKSGVKMAIGGPDHNIGHFLKFNYPGDGATAGGVRFYDGTSATATAGLSGEGNLTLAGSLYFSDNPTSPEVGIYYGSTNPNGVVYAKPGSLYLRTSGGSGTSLYVQESSVGSSTGWVGK